MAVPQRIIHFWFLAYLSWVIMVKAQTDTERLGGSQKGSRILKVSPAAGREWDSLEKTVFWLLEG